MSHDIPISECRRRHPRDLALLERLFAEWKRGRTRHNVQAHQRLDAIEAQLALLEQTVRMTDRPAVVGIEGGSRTRRSRTVVPFTIQ